jgi:hypothetical protein
MSYKPRYCCECGEKIERTSWRFLFSQRFCELCETRFGLVDVIPTLVLIFGLIMSVVGLGNFLRQPEKQLIVSSNPISGSGQNFNKPATAQTNVIQNIDKPNATPKEINSSAPLKQTPATFTQKESGGQVKNQIASAPEISYFCGAQTKKGTPCTHRVKNGGRCWQHEGQPAMLPPNKLIANQ